MSIDSHCGEKTEAAIVEATRRRYADAALRVITESGCCGAAATDPITSDLYGKHEAEGLPANALKASLGCGNPTALAELHAGETVLDLGSGGGIDVLLSAKRVGPAGFVFGLDMTDEMLDLAEKNRAAAGATNVKFLKGRIEEIPLPEASVDVIVSNCVINLSTDKGRVLREALRVLRPGGRVAVSDVVVQGEFPPEVRRDAESWAGCLAGALEETEYRRLLAEAGFTDVEVQVTRTYDPADLAGSSCCSGSSCGTALASPPASGTGRLVSAFIRARKPATSHGTRT